MNEIIDKKINMISFIFFYSFLNDKMNVVVLKAHFLNSFL